MATRNVKFSRAHFLRAYIFCSHTLVGLSKERVNYKNAREIRKTRVVTGEPKIN